MLSAEMAQARGVLDELQKVDPAFSELSLYEVINKIASQYPHRPALQFMGKITTFEEMSKNISATAAEFERRGISQGDCVALCAPNCPQAIVTLYALNKIGAVAVLLNPLLPSAQLLNQIEDAGCKGLIILDLLMPKLLKELRRAEGKNNAARAINEPRVINGQGFVMLIKLSDEMSHSTALRYKLLLAFRLLRTGIYTRLNRHFADSIFTGSPAKARYENSSLTVKPETPAPAKQPAVIIFSGGTSGSPKPVIHTSESINLAAMQCLATEPPIEEGMSMLTVLPIFHIYGLTVALHLALLAAGRCILLPRFTHCGMVRVLIKDKPTYMAGVPAIYASLLKSKHLKEAEKKGKLDFSGFRIGFCGGDKLDDSTLLGFNEMIRRNGGAGRIVDGYGLTECCPVTVMPRDGTGPSDSIGRPFSGIELCIVYPETDEELQNGEVGEICIRAQSTMLRYLGSTSDSSDVFRLHSDGMLWLHTGDLGKQDEDGYLYLTARMSRIIKVSGYSVFPSYVENVLEDHPGISKAAITSYNKGSAQVHIKASIVLKKGYFRAASNLFSKSKLLRKSAENKARRQILDYCHQKLAPWSIPKIIEFRASLPVNMLGKTAYGQLGQD